MSLTRPGNSMHNPICYCETFVIVVIVLFKSFCTIMYCCPFWFNSTSSSIKKLKSSYNSVLRRLLFIRMPYSASEMFVSCGISSFYEILRKCIFDFSERISKNTISIIEAYLSPKVYIVSPIRHRVGKMPAFMSKVHAGGIYRRLLVFTGVYWNLPAFTDIAGLCYYSLY